jgi:hypothetical protein
MEREAAKAPDLDALTGSQGAAHLFQDAAHRELDIFVGEMTLLSRENIDELGFHHNG